MDDVIRRQQMAQQRAEMQLYLNVAAVLATQQLDRADDAERRQYMQSRR
jgi:hypothetical protein